MGRPQAPHLLTLLDVSHEARVDFAAPPDRIWAYLKRTDLFEEWWAWMRDVRLEGDALTAGSTIGFVIDPPIPYHLDISVAVTEAQPERLLRGRVTGDLTGDATFELEGDENGSCVRIAWDVRISSPLIKPVIVVARPLLLRAQSWAVTVALRGFRSYLREQGYAA